MNNGDMPAFPWSGGERPIADGLTKREWLAGKMLQGILASSVDEFPEDGKAARWAMEYADALLQKLDKKPEENP